MRRRAAPASARPRAFGERGSIGNASPASCGFSLIELMVSMALGLIVVLAITGVLVRSESSKRTMTGVNDMSQTGAYLSYVLDRALRSAGSGYTQRWDSAFGCALNVSRSDTGVVLPRGSAMPAPFAATTRTPRLAPVVIGKNQSSAGSDVLTVMTGSAGYGESPNRVQPGSVTSAGLRLPNTIGLNSGDLVLLAESGVGCLLEQVQVTPAFAGGANQALPLGGTYYTASSTGMALASFGVSNNTFAMPLGNATNNAPLFQLIGVGDNATLQSYDLLRLDGTDAPVPIADGVVELHALYGIDTTPAPDGVIDDWFDPGVAPYRSADLLDGSATAQANLRRIVAIRVALVLRSPQVERPNPPTAANPTGEPVSPPTLTLFPDLAAKGLTQTVTLSGDDRNRRFRVVDFTVPLRNLLLPRP